MIGIYGIFRKSDDRCMYVGQSKDVNGRIKNHLSGRSNNTSFNKEEYYGQMIEQHFINDKQYRLDREAYWIEQLNPELNKIRDRHQTEKTKKKIGETTKENHADFSGENNPMYGRHHSEQTIKKMTGHKWINNGEITKHVKEEELDKYINDGWNIGRLKYNRKIRRK